MVVADGDNESKTERGGHLRSCMNAASRRSAPEAAVIDCLIPSLNLTPEVVRLVEDRLVKPDVVALLLDTVFDPVFDTDRFIGVSRVVRGDWHDLC